MKIHALYFFDENQLLIGLETGVEKWSLEDISRLVDYHVEKGHSHELTQNGITICCSCKVFLGEKAGIEAGKISHGLCAPCAKGLYGIEL